MQGGRATEINLNQQNLSDLRSHQNFRINISIFEEILKSKGSRFPVSSFVWPALHFKSGKVCFPSFVPGHQHKLHINLSLQSRIQKYIWNPMNFVYLSCGYIYASSLVVFYVKGFLAWCSLGLINDSKSVLTLHMPIFQSETLQDGMFCKCWCP